MADLSSKKHQILIYGLGKSGRAVARFLAHEGVKAHWYDRNPSAEDKSLIYKLGWPQSDLNSIYKTVIAAPGVPINHPDLITLSSCGAEIIGEVLLATRLRPKRPLIGITGTAGKGSTTVLITHLLQAHGYKALAGGNIDPPLLDIIDTAEIAVVELSSFQLERTPHLRLPVAVITNLGIDHLDRHQTIYTYHEVKRNITAWQQHEDILILPQGLAISTAAQKRTFSSSAITLKNGAEVLATAELPINVYPANAAAAVLAVEAMLEYLGAPVNVNFLAHILKHAQPIAGRFETVAVTGNVRFINDSIATRTLAVKAALERAQGPIAGLVGGRDKGAELDTLKEAARGKVIKIIAFGEDGEYLAKKLGYPYQIIRGQDGEKTMQAAAQAGLEALGGPDKAGTVLLAPIGTSFDLFSDYKERGESFTRAACMLISSKIPLIKESKI